MLSALPGSGHDGAGRRQSQGAGARNDQRGDGQQEGEAEDPHLGQTVWGENEMTAWSEKGVITDEEPEQENCQGERVHPGDEMPRYEVGQLLNRRLGGLGVLNHLDDLGQRRLTTHPGGLESERAGLVDGGADNLGARSLFHRDALAGDHRLVHRRVTHGDFAVDGNALTGAHHDNVADPDLIGGYLQLLPFSDHVRRPGLQANQFPDGFRGAAAGQRFHVPPQHDKGCQQGG